MKIMANFRQKKAVEKLIENGGNLGQAMRDAGYSHSTSLVPKKLTDSKGFHELMEQHGLNPDLIVVSLVDDIKAKPGHRVGELSLGADLLGLKKKSEGPTVAVQVNFKSDKEDYA